MPCERTPQRSDVMMTSAMILASSPDVPIAVRASIVKSTRVSTGTLMFSSAIRVSRSGKENLSGVENVQRVERLLDVTLHIDRYRTEGLLQIRTLEHTDPMLAGKRPPHRQRGLEDFGDHLLCFVPLLRIA